MIPEPPKPGPDRLARSVVLLFVAASLQFVYLQMNPSYGTSDPSEPVRVAHTLAKRGEFADPHPSLPTGPTAELAPAWPAVLAGFFLVTNGTVKEMSMLAILASSVLWGICLLALPILSRDLWGTEVPGWIAVGVGLLPIAPITPIWEAVPAAAALVWSCVIMNRLTAWGCGAVAGALAWLNPVAAMGAGVYWLARRRPTWLQMSGFAGMAVLVVLPWIVRNYQVFGAFVPVRDNFGLELKMAFRDDTKLTLAELMRMVDIPPHPNQSVVEARKLVAMGEVAYMKSCGSEAFEWIGEHPSAAAGLVTKRALLWWFPYRLDLVPYPWLTCAVTFLAIVGLWMMGRAGLPLAMLVVSFSLPYYLVQSSWRYAVPVAWVFTLGVGFVVWSVGRKLIPQTGKLDEKRRLKATSATTGY